MLKKVLVVEDSELLHNMYRLALKRYKGCQYVKATNGREGLDILASEKNVDLILLDINMPVMNGIEFLQAAKQQDSYKDIPIIIISTEGKEEDTRRGLEMGARAYITKPFQSITLHDLIDKIVGEKKGSTPA